MWGGWCTDVVKGPYGVACGKTFARSGICFHSIYLLWWGMGVRWSSGMTDGVVGYPWRQLPWVVFLYTGCRSICGGPYVFCKWNTSLGCIFFEGCTGLGIGVPHFFYGSYLFQKSEGRISYAGKGILRRVLQLRVIIVAWGLLWIGLFRVWKVKVPPRVAFFS